MEMKDILEPNRQLNYEFAQLSRARLHVREMEEAARKLDKSLRKKCGISRGEETDLRRNSFAFWTPACLPFWDKAWSTQQYAEIGCWLRHQWSINGFNNTLDLFANHMATQSELFAWITVWWPGGRCLKLEYNPDVNA